MSKKMRAVVCVFLFMFFIGISDITLMRVSAEPNTEAEASIPHTSIDTGTKDRDIAVEILCDHLSEDIADLTTQMRECNVSDLVETDDYVYAYFDKDFSTTPVYDVYAVIRTANGTYTFVTLNTPEKLTAGQVDQQLQQIAGNADTSAS